LVSVSPPPLCPALMLWVCSFPTSFLTLGPGLVLVCLGSMPCLGLCTHWSETLVTSRSAQIPPPYYHQFSANRLSSD
jgi:ABC-type transport system involved in cytochrome c biogenesis permease subunit